MCPNSSSKTKNKRVNTEGLELMYTKYWSLKGIDKILNSNKKSITNKHANYVKYINKLFDLEIYFIGLYMNTFDFLNLNKIPKTIIVSSSLKSLYSLHSAHKLNMLGYGGSALVLLRQAFENLMIGKFCAVEKNKKLFSKWDSFATINLTHDVLNKIKTPDMAPLKEFWKILNLYTHPTRQSQQPTLIYEHNRELVDANFPLFVVLLSCNYHLINKFFLNPSISQIIQSYLDVGYKRYKKRKRGMADLLKIDTIRLNKKSKKLVMTYSKDWILLD